MLITTKIKDAELLYEIRNLDKSIKADRQTLAETLDPALFSSLRESVNTLAELTTRWKKIPKNRRELAESILEDADNIARSVFSGVSRFSGSNTYSWEFGPTPNAKTITSEGERYSKKNWYTRTNAHTHIVLSLEWIIDYNREIAALSKDDHLILLGMKNDEAVWVEFVRGKAVSRSGWIAHQDGVLYHSTKSADHAKKNLLKKLKPKIDSAPLGAIISLTKVRKLTGWCKPGCLVWCDKYLGGKTRAPREQILSAITVALNDRCVYAAKLQRLLEER